ncbi:Sds3-like-domain-containing protein [Neocallimastix lanati (nom. inval.)]|nr:Sds3-like-domain-containing protein [Neocallimastix sp. JGI-2020a]
MVVVKVSNNNETNSATPASTVTEKEIKEEPQAEKSEMGKKEKKYRLYIDKLEQLNNDFNANKEKLYKEKLNNYHKELHQLQEGTHPEFLSKIEKLDKARQEAIQFHEYMKECRIHCTNVLYENEIKAAMDEYMQEIQGLREKMLENIENKKRKLKEESENDIIHEQAIDIQKNRTTRRTQKSHDDKKEKRRKNTSRVHQGVPFLLKENEIADDMNILKKGSYVPPVKKSGKGKKK